MALTAVQICNMALVAIGERTITALTDANENGRRCNQLYDFARQSVLQAHPWNFATVVKPLALLNGETVPDWDYLYSYPSNCLAVRRVYNESTVGDPREHKYRTLTSPDTYTHAIATDQVDAYIEYTYDAMDPTRYSKSFVQALVFYLAFLLSPKLTGNEKKASTMLQLYNLEISNAQQHDAQESNNPHEKRSVYYDAR